MSVSERDYLKARRDRALGTIMRHLESQMFSTMSREQQLAARQVVIDALNSYHDSVLDLLKSDDGLRNEMVPDILERLDKMTGLLTRSLGQEIRHPSESATRQARN